MEENIEARTRLQVADKRTLFHSLMALNDRLLYLNKFPVPMDDFALSMLPEEAEEALAIVKNSPARRSVVEVNNLHFNATVTVNQTASRVFNLTDYPSEVPLGKRTKFFQVMGDLYAEQARRYREEVLDWCQKQAQLEDQVLRTCKVLRAIVHSCNTIGQYRRVSPELITFLPAAYQDGLKGMSKTSPYPALTLEPEEIEAAMSNLAYASLLPTHRSEEIYLKRPKYNQQSNYTLQDFPRTSSFNRQAPRTLNI